MLKQWLGFIPLSPRSLTPCSNQLRSPWCLLSAHPVSIYSQCQLAVFTGSVWWQCLLSVSAVSMYCQGLLSLGIGIMLWHCILSISLGIINPCVSRHYLLVCVCWQCLSTMSVVNVCCQHVLSGCSAVRMFGECLLSVCAIRTHCQHQVQLTLSADSVCWQCM